MRCCFRVWLKLEILEEGGIIILPTFWNSLHSCLQSIIWKWEFFLTSAILMTCSSSFSSYFRATHLTTSEQSLLWLMSDEIKVPLNCLVLQYGWHQQSHKGLNCGKVHGWSRVMIFLRLVMLGKHGLNGLKSSVAAVKSIYVFYLNGKIT